MTTEKRRLWLRLAAATVLAFPACTLLEGQAAADSEEIPAQAGFQRHPLDEPGLHARHLIGRSSVQGAPVDRTAWSSWKPEGLDAIKAPATVTTDTAGRPALH